MERDARAPAREFLGISATLAGLVFALAAFFDTGPDIGALSVGKVLLNYSGLSALGATGVALGELWRQEGMTWRHFLLLRGTANDFPESALTYLAWAVLGLTLGYGTLLVPQESV
jgi:hypothetical protein